MPPSIDADASPNGPPSPLPCPGRGGSSATAFSSVEMEAKEDENERNFYAADPTSHLTSIEFVSRGRCLEHSSCVPSRRVGWTMDFQQSNGVDVHEEKEDLSVVPLFRWHINIKSLLMN